MPDDDARTPLGFEFGVTPLAVTPLAGRDNVRPAAPSPVLDSVELDIDDLPDLEEPDALTTTIVWRSTFMKHARRADVFGSGFDVAPAVRATVIADEANQRKAATLRLSDRVAESERQREPAASRTAESKALAPAARPTVMETFPAAVDELPDLEDPVDSYVWCETFIKHARRADTALADFNSELDTRFGPADALRVSCAALKDSCTELCATVTDNSSALASLIALMGQMHAKVSTLEAATAKNAADVATTTAALAATVAAQATTAAAVTEFSTTVNDAVVDHVGRHFGPLRSDVSSLGQEVVSLGPRIDALVEHVTTNDGVLGELDKHVTEAESLGPRLTELDVRVTTLLANMHGDPPPPAAPLPGAPVADDAVLPHKFPADVAPQSTPASTGVTTGNSGPDTPPPTVAGMSTPASK